MQLITNIVARKRNSLEAKKESEIYRGEQNQTITNDIVQRRPLLIFPYRKSFTYHQPDAAAENHGKHDTEYNESHNSLSQLFVSELFANELFITELSVTELFTIEILTVFITCSILKGLHA